MDRRRIGAFKGRTERRPGRPPGERLDITESVAPGGRGNVYVNRERVRIGSGPGAV